MDVNRILTEELKTADVKAFEVENHQGGYAEPMTFQEACETARALSISSHSVWLVRRTHAYAPDAIYCCGDLYEPTLREVPNDEKVSG